jgi:hypothetical protein
MEINTKTLIARLKQHRVSEEAIIASKVNPVLVLARDCTNSSEIDFSTLSLKDIELALEVVLYYDPEYPEEVEPDHPIKVYKKTWGLISALHKLKPRGESGCVFI